MTVRPCLGTLVFAATLASCGSDTSAASETTPVANKEDGELGITSAQFETPSMTAGDDFVLAEDKQKYIRDTELMVLVLGQDAWPIIRAPLQGKDSAPLRNLLASDFKGSLFEGDGQILEHGPIRVQSWTDADRVEVDADGLIAAFESYNALFETIQSVKYHTTQMSPQTHLDLTGKWDVRWDMHIKGTLPNGDLAEYTFVCELEFDRFNDDIIKGEDATGGWINDFVIVDATFVHGPALMAEITDTSGIDTEAFDDNWDKTEPPYFAITGGAHLLDYDRDGNMDVLLTGENQPYLYRGLGDGTFDDTSASSKLLRGNPRKVQAALVADLDSDRFEDVLLMILGRTTLPDGRVIPKQRYELYANNGDGTFRRIPADKTNLGDFRYEPGFIGTAVADYDGDGMLDLYVGKGGKLAPKGQRRTQWLDDNSSPEGLLLRNTGDWQFADTTEAAGMSGRHTDTFGALWLDFERDGDSDLFIANHMGRNILWVNQGDGTFESAPLDQGFGGFSMGGTAGDLDGDGDPDLYIANMYSSAGSRILDNLRPEYFPEGAFEDILGFVEGNILYENEGLTAGAGALKPLGVEVGVDNAGWAYGPGLVDLDGDGALDIYAPAGFQSVTRSKPDT